MVKDTIETKTVVLNGPHDLEFQDGSIDPSDLKENEIIAETLYSVISPGTETAAYRGDPPLRPGNPYPRVVGYCNVAKVLVTGKRVTRLSSGDLIYTFQSHRSAFKCEESSVVFELPDGADPVLCATTYLYHLGYNALLKGGYAPGYNVAVIGLGALGLTTVALAAVLGGNVYACSARESGCRHAKQMGARQVFDKSDKTLFDQIEADTNETGIDLVVTTSNSWEDWLLALRLARNGGAIAALGFPGRGVDPPAFNPLSPQYFYVKQLQITACGYTPHNDLPPGDMRFNIKRNCQFLLGLILSGRLKPESIVSEVVGWDTIEQVYKRMIEKDRSLITCALTWK